jgi:hypothetical protein
MQVSDKAEHLIAQIQEVHKATVQNFFLINNSTEFLQDSRAKHKESVDRKRHAVEFDKGDFV